MTSSPLYANIARWQAELEGDPDEQYIVEGIHSGFYITKPDVHVKPAYCSNYRSATCIENRPRVDEQLRREVALGRYHVTSVKPPIISAIGAIPKPNSNDLRIIQDFSRPLGRSVNSYAEPDSHSFVSVDTATGLLQKGSYMCKVDLSEAYRYACLHPSQYNFTGLQWTFEGDSKPTYMQDTRLPFGSSESVGCFHRITQSIVRMMRRMVTCSVICYIDDFFILSPSKEQCAHSKDVLISLLTDLGFAVNHKKSVGPSQQVTFLGVMLDSVSMTMSIPPCKLQETRDAAVDWCKRSKATKRQLQSLIGKIAWAAKCVKAIRPVLRSLIDLQKTLKHPSHHVRIPKQAQLDLRYFAQWCFWFNGVVLIHTDRPQPATTLYTDASPDAGAAYCQGDFLFSNWQADLPCIRNETIFVKELCAVLLAFRRWDRMWENKTVHLYCDNIGVVWALRKGLTRHVFGNTILKEILWRSAYLNIAIKVNYISSKDNFLADAISRLNIRHFRLRAAYYLSLIGLYILDPAYNALYHMSPGSYVSLL